MRVRLFAIPPAHLPSFSVWEIWTSTSFYQTLIGAFGVVTLHCVSLRSCSMKTKVKTVCGLLLISIFIWLSGGLGTESRVVWGR